MRRPFLLRRTLSLLLSLSLALPSPALALREMQRTEYPAGLEELETHLVKGESTSTGLEENYPLWNLFTRGIQDYDLTKKQLKTVARAHQEFFREGG